ncbi:hypothetical protein JCGZ_11739 [Jatropha curcas]|uniref:Mitochondrial import inner membrane translocase subunit TIM50 n=1 Tax=Jatropha curcas TaxID=180498 RepID=A0A067K8M6_JATCU|nr:uncharacterized protein LOC105640643 [Jatropha curcas]KDP31363.1 hypothetical protein JCGZ_11739 [Jatropha curcas]
MASCTLDIISCKDKKKRKNRSEVHDPLNKVNVIIHDSTSKSYLVRNASLERYTSLDPPINNILESDVLDSQCNLESNCSQTNKKKNKKRKKKSKIKQDSQIDCQEDPSPIKNDSTGKSSSHESIVDTNTREDVIDINTDLETVLPSELSQSHRKRKRKKRKLNGTVINDKSQSLVVEEERSDSPRSPNTSMLNKLDNNDEAGTGLVDYEMKAQLEIDCVKRRVSPETRENVESVKVATQTSSDLNEVHSFELSENRLERIQAGEPAASVTVLENALTEKTSSYCSSGDFLLLESKNIIEAKRDSDIDVPIKEENLSKASASSIKGPQAGCADKKLLILDVNGLLADIVPYCYDSYKADIIISGKSVFKRPFCDDFLQFCFEKFNVGVWSSRTKKNVRMVVDFLLGDSRHKLLFCWDQSHCTDTGFNTLENSHKPLVLKELKKLWDKLEPDLPWNKGVYDQSNTLLLDDSPYKALSNPANTAIFPYSYKYKNSKDSSLGPGGNLRLYLEKLAEAQNVQEFVAQNPFGQPAITEANPFWGFYQKILSGTSSKKQDVASISGMEQQQLT